jgi:hypothetical protein
MNPLFPLFKIDTQNLKTVVSAQPIKLQLQDELVTSNQNLQLEHKSTFFGGVPHQLPIWTRCNWNQLKLVKGIIKIPLES